MISILAVIPANRLSFNETIESMFSDDDPHLVDYLASKRLFGGDELVGVVYQDPQLFEPVGLTRLSNLAEELSAISGVQAASTQNLADHLARH